VSERHADSTVADVRDRRRTPVASRAFNVLLLLVCVAGAVGVLGGRTATATEDAHGYSLTLLYPHTIRPGLDALWKLTIVHRGGFKGPVTVAVTSSYFGLFETQGFYPTPSSTTSDRSWVYMKFTPPKHGNTLTIRYDAYLQPYIPPTDLLANHATVAVVRAGKHVAAVPYTVWIWP
jgi:hypothetical protein